MRLYNHFSDPADGVLRRGGLLELARLFFAPNYAGILVTHLLQSLTTEGEDSKSESKGVVAGTAEAEVDIQQLTNWAELTLLEGQPANLEFVSHPNQLVYISLKPLSEQSLSAPTTHV